MLPFHIYPAQPMPRLFELSDGRFQLLDATPVGAFLPGYQYLLVDSVLAEFLQALELGRVSYEPAIIFDRATGKEYRDHIRIRVSQYFTHDQLCDLDVDGLRLLTMDDEFYFVSPALKTLLKQSGFDYLCFSAGLSDFAAGGAA